MPRDGRPQRTARIQRKGLALALALFVHALFLAVLVFSLRWQNRPSAPVEAELYAPPPKTVVAERPPPPPPEPKAEPKPEPVKPPPKVEPKVEKPDPRAAEIALKAKQEEEKKRRAEIEREKQEQAKREAAKKAADEKKATEVRERQAREAEALRAQAEREQKTQAEAAARAAAQAEATARSKAQADWIERIRAKIKGNVNFLPEGNPEAIFDVVQLPTGEVIDVQLRKSSGVRAYDDEVQRAILKSSPLPAPPRPEMFVRVLTLKFRPKD